MRDLRNPRAFVVTRHDVTYDELMEYVAGAVVSQPVINPMINQ